ncbi:MAG: PEP-CTERM sorting domain-containing protein [Burkholderiaceae bacterium]
MKTRFLAAAALMALAAGAQAAAPVFADTFDANPAVGVDLTPANWSLSGNGDVDIIGDGYFDFIPGNGKYIDLDGSDGAAGHLATSFGVAAGVYTATFQLAGNHRDGSTDAVTVTFGNTTQIFNIGAQDAFTTYSLTTTAAAGDLSLSFHDGRDGNVGALLDNVSVTAVPEPTGATLLLAGLLGLGAVARRRRV